jgi:hypothetical protein
VLTLLLVEPLRETVAKGRMRRVAAASSARSGGNAGARAREGSAHMVGARRKSACRTSNRRSAAPYGDEGELEEEGRPRDLDGWGAAWTGSIRMQTPQTKASPRDRTAVPFGSATEGITARRSATLELLFLADAVPEPPLQSSRRKRPSPSTCTSNAPTSGAAAATRKRKARRAGRLGDAMACRG